MYCTMKVICTHLCSPVPVASPAWNAITHRPPSTLCPSTSMLLTLKANLRVMLSEGSTPPIRKLSSGKLPNTVSSFSSAKRKNESVKISQEDPEKQNNNLVHGHNYCVRETRITAWANSFNLRDKRQQNRGGVFRVQTWEWNQRCSPPSTLSAPTVTAS